MKKTALFLFFWLVISVAFAQENQPTGTEGFQGISKVFSFDTTLRLEDLEGTEYNDLLKEGTYYALLIGIQEYKDAKVGNLRRPVIDAQNLYDILAENYTFEKANMQFLKNPTRSEILQSLDSLQKKITDKDNLLVFYAGHGFWDGGMETGYWLTKEAISDDKSTWFSNLELLNYLKNIKSRHTLLVSDACFSGSIFKTTLRDFNDELDLSTARMYNTPSRRAMTSGALTKVPDQSSFTDFLIKQLRKNKDIYLSSSDLFFAIKNPIIRDTESSAGGSILPQFGELNLADHQGGDFIFIRRR